MLLGLLLDRLLLLDGLLLLWRRGLRCRRLLLLLLLRLLRRGRVRGPLLGLLRRLLVIHVAHGWRRRACGDAGRDGEEYRLEESARGDCELECDNGLARAQGQCVTVLFE